MQAGHDDAARQPSAYELRAREQIAAWKAPQPSKRLARWMSAVNRPLEATTDALLRSKSLGPILEKSVEGLVKLTHDAAQWSVRHEQVFAKFREAGHAHVRTHADLTSLDLEAIDAQVARLSAKYKAIAVADGAAMGVIGLAGIPLDLISMTTLSLRAIGEYASHCGFDCQSQAERLFALNVLGLASSPNDEAKANSMAQLMRIARDVATPGERAELEKNLFMNVMQQIASTVSVRLTRAKAAQTLPAVGALVGVSFNAYFASKVCDAAYHLYRERFLATKYGPSVIAS